MRPGDHSVMRYLATLVSDAIAPGRTAMEYLAGHRQRYLPPLRLFVIMSLLAFFVGKLTIHVDTVPVSLGVDTSAISANRAHMTTHNTRCDRDPAARAGDALRLLHRRQAHTRVAVLVPSRRGTSSRSSTSRPRSPSR